ncbi:MAG: Fe-S cluster assembly protein SufD [Dehalococcoidia bacterium]
MANTSTGSDNFSAAFAAVQSRPDAGPDWLRSLRETAMLNFQETGFPVQRKGNEAWKYTDLRALAQTSFAYPETPGSVSPSRLASILPFDDGFARITFVDGRFAAELSTSLDLPGVTISPLSRALGSNGASLRQHFGPGQDRPEDSFTSLNTALFQDGALIEVTGEIDTPLHVVYITSDQPGPIAVFPRTIIIARPMSRVALIESYVSAGDGQSLTDAVTDIVVEDGATVDHYRLLVENPKSYHVGRLNTVLRRDSTFQSLVYETGSHLGRLDAVTLFDDTGSSASLRGLYITSGDQHIDNLITIDHAKPHNTSRLSYKGILDGKSSAVFGGTVFVRKGADKTDSHQQDKNLLLSEEAVVNSKPALEIYADDVKAGHGATAGAVADEALFYMQSRGIDAETAMRLLVQGFASEILDAVAIEPLRLWLEQQALNALPRFEQTISE